MQRINLAVALNAAHAVVAQKQLLYTYGAYFHFLLCRAASASISR